MAITMSSTLNNIYRKLGLSHLPNPLLDDQLVDVIVEESLPTFSKFFPMFHRVVVNTKTDAVPGATGHYYLLPDVTELEILGIKDFFRSNRSFGYSAYNDDPYYGRGTNPYDAMASQAAINVASMSNMPDTFLFHPPNIIEIFPKRIFGNTLLVNVKAVHYQHLATIKLTLKDEWYKLVELDAKITLYEILKNIDGTQTPFGNIDIKVDRWADAYNDREQLLESWHSKAIKEPERKKVFFG